MPPWGAWDRWRARRRAAAFWRWFAGEADDLRTALGRAPQAGEIPPALSDRVRELNRRTTAYHPLVRALLGGSADEPELVLTADGNPDGADGVRFLARSAPGLPAWRVRAFKPRLEVARCVCRTKSVTLTPDDLDFAIIDVENPDHPLVTLLVLYVRGLAGPHGAEVEVAAERLLQSVLGEELALRCGEFIVRYDSERPLERLAEIPRTPLSQIAGLLDGLEHRLGIRAR